MSHESIGVSCEPGTNAVVAAGALPRGHSGTVYEVATDDAGPDVGDAGDCVAVRAAADRYSVGAVCDLEFGVSFRLAVLLLATS